MTIYFDLDGTLIDSSRRHAILLKKLLQENDLDCINWDENAYLAYKRLGNNTFSYLTKCMNIDEIKARILCKEWALHIEDEQFLQYDILYDETRPLLELLSDRNIAVAFISARNNKLGLIKFLERVGIKEYAEKIYVVNTKNAIQNKIDAIINVVCPEDIIVGDTEVELELARTLGQRIVLLNRGFRSKEFWEDKNIKNFDHISDILFEYINDTNNNIN